MVISLAVLTDTHPRYRPDRLEELEMGSGVSFHFRSVKLLDFRDRMDELLASRKRLGRGLITRLMIFLEWLVALPPEIKQGYYAEQVKQHGEDDDMTYVSYIEQMAIERVEKQLRAEGHLQGRATQLLRQLELKFGNLPRNVRRRVEKAGPTELDLWAERILFAPSIEAVLADFGAASAD